MSEYIACLSDPARPGQIELIACRHDPRLECGEGFDMLRQRGWPTLEWTLPVVDRAETMNALTSILRHMRVGNGFYTCAPMVARGEAIGLTTRRAPPPRPGLLSRMGLRRGAA